MKSKHSAFISLIVILVFIFISFPVVSAELETQASEEYESEQLIHTVLSPGPEEGFWWNLYRFLGIKKKSKAEKSSRSAKHSSTRPERYSPPPTNSENPTAYGRKSSGPDSRSQSPDSYRENYKAPSSNSKSPVNQGGRVKNHQRSDMSAVRNVKKKPLHISRKDRSDGLSEVEIGFSFGTSHSITDIAANKGLGFNDFVDYHTNNYNFNGGFFTRFKLNYWFGIKMGMDFLSLSAHAPVDLMSDNPSEPYRFSNDIFEFYGRTEFMVPALERSPLDLWGFVGIGLFFSDASVFDQDDRRIELSQEYSQLQPVIPLGAGFSYKVTPSIRLGYEFAWRNTIFNYLDGMDTDMISGSATSYDQYFLNNIQISFIF